MAEGADRLDDLARTASEADGGIWNPPFCGDIPLRIARDGTWHYAGSPILRPALVRLFARVLRYEDGRFMLVTPVEKVGIEVEDAPFLAVELATDGDRLRLRTNLDEWITADAEHPLRFDRAPDGGIKPYLRIRGDLWALLTRAAAVEIIDRGTVRGDHFGIVSAGSFFTIGPASEASDDAF